MVDIKSDDLKIIDFTGAKESGNDDNTILGHPNYIAPELYFNDNDEYDLEGLDIYSLGIILYELTYGEKPYKRNNNSIGNPKEFKRIFANIDFNNNYSEDLNKLISKLITFKESRYSLKNILDSKWFRKMQSK